MNAATVLVLVILILMLSGAAYYSYKTTRYGSWCSGCPKRSSCHQNPINCTIKKE